jgi:hypothetical protein
MGQVITISILKNSIIFTINHRIEKAVLIETAQSTRKLNDIICLQLPLILHVK